MSRSRLPYPGLRAFRRDEADIFFGRDDEIDAITDSLVGNRFLAVLGASGSGKSSLVRTGLLETLNGGFNPVGAGWRIADFHPGADPIGNLAAALAEASQATDPPTEVAALAERLRHGPRSIVEWCTEGEGAARPLKPGNQLLILADQFEELFSYGGASARADAHVLAGLLVESARSERAPIYVVLTMRSDYFGACGAFPELAEAISGSLFLTPRMRREACREAILGPAGVVGFEIADDLQTLLLNDMENFAPFSGAEGGEATQAGRQADQLPLMQYVLNRMWQRAAPPALGPIRLRAQDYRAIGGLIGALDEHGDDVAGKLDVPAGTVERVFRSLIRGQSVALATRDPHRLQDIAEIGGIPLDDVVKVVTAFAADDCQFLRVDRPVRPQSWADINHESLIRQWGSLSGWLTTEAFAADTWRNLASDTADWKRDGRKPEALIGGSVLDRRLDWWQAQQPTQAWADRYPVPVRGSEAAVTVEDVGAFLDASVGARVAERRRQQAQRQRLRMAGAALIALTLGATAYGYVSERSFAQTQRVNAAILAGKNRQLETKQALLAAETGRAQKAESVALKAKGEALLKAYEASRSALAASAARSRADAKARQAREALVQANRATEAMVAQLEHDVLKLEQERDSVETSAAGIRAQAIQLAEQLASSRNFHSSRQRSNLQAALYARVEAMAAEARLSSVGLNQPPEAVAADVSNSAAWIRSVGTDRTTLSRTRYLDGRAAELRQDYVAAAGAYGAALAPALAGKAPPDEPALEAAAALILLHRRGIQLPEQERAADWCKTLASDRLDDSEAIALAMCRAAVADLRQQQGNEGEAATLLTQIQANPAAQPPGLGTGENSAEKENPETSLRRLQLRLFVQQVQRLRGESAVSDPLLEQAKRRWGANDGTEEASSLYATALEARAEDEDEEVAFAVREPLLLSGSSSTGYLIDALPSLWVRTTADESLTPGDFENQLNGVRPTAALVAAAATLNRRQAPYKPLYDTDMPVTREDLLAQALKRLETRLEGLSSSLLESARQDDLLADLQLLSGEGAPVGKLHTTPPERARIRSILSALAKFREICTRLPAEAAGCNARAGATARELAPLAEWERTQPPPSPEAAIEEADSAEGDAAREPWLGGYDVVGYRSGRAVRGRDDLKLPYKGRTLLFAREPNKRAFESARTSYEPAYGGAAIDWLTVGERVVGSGRLFCRDGDRIYLFGLADQREALCPSGYPSTALLEKIRASDAAWRSLSGEDLAPAVPRLRYVDAVAGVTHSDAGFYRSYELPAEGRIVAPAAGRISRSSTAILIQHPDGTTSTLSTALPGRLQTDLRSGTLVQAGSEIPIVGDRPKTVRWQHYRMNFERRRIPVPPSQVGL